MSSVTALGSTTAGAERAPRTLRANVTLAFVGDAASKASALVSLVVLARVLSTAEMARFGVAFALVTLLTTVLDAGASTVIVRDGAADRAVRGKLVLGSALGRLPLLVLVAVASVPLGARLGAPGGALAIVALSVVSAALLTLYAVFRAGQDLGVEAWAKLGLAVAGPIVVLAATAAEPTSLVAILALALPGIAVVGALVRRARRAAPWTVAAPPLPTAAAGVPFALMALATLAYYRSGTLVLGATASHEETAAYTLAAAVGFGALVLPNAITTGLLPRLSADASAAARSAVTRTALRWSIAACVAATLALCAFAAYGVVPVFGARYADAAAPLAILALSLPLVGISTVVGTLLVSERRTRPVALQVGLSLVLNLVVCVLLVDRFGADGAALATLLTEAFAAVFLTVVAREPLGLGPTLAASRARALGLGRVLDEPTRALGLFVVGLTLLLEIVALHNRYGLRVTADTPTYISLLRQLALHPLHAPASPFLSGTVNLSHATPDLQLLALLWRAFASFGWVNHDLIDLLPAYRMLALKGLVVTVVLFHALFVWARHQSGSSRVAWLTVAVLPAVWGPALIISPGDFSLNGLMSTADHSEALAIALVLYALVVLDGQLRLGRLAGAAALVGGVMVTHPFTGVRLAALASGLACLHVLLGDERRTWKLTPPALLLGYLLAAAWPAYSLAEGMKVGSIEGWQLVLVLALTPYACLAVRLVGGPLLRRLTARPSRTLARLDRADAALGLARVGMVGVALVITRALWLYWHPDPWFHTNRPAIYWTGHDLVYWPLLLAPGLAGLAGLARAARHGRPLPLLWASGCVAIGLLGVAGLQIPLWHRFLLFAQIPVAFGVAVVLANRDWSLPRAMVATTLVASVLFAFGALVLMPQNVTYFGNPLQGGWELGRFIPAGSKTVVASDPASEYYVLALDDRVLTMTTWHIGGKSELLPSRRGYRLMHRLYVGDRWRAAAQQMWRLGVRYVVANRGFRMQEPTVDRFSSRDTPYIVHSWDDLDEVLAYMRRLGRVSTKVGAVDEYHVYRLDRRKLFAAKGKR